MASPEAALAMTLPPVDATMDIGAMIYPGSVVPRRNECARARARDRWCAELQRVARSNDVHLRERRELPAQSG
jgi:hypothetical protein